MLTSLATLSFAQLVTCPLSDAITQDCNGNNTDDVCDIAVFGTSQDADSDGIPDECDFRSCLPTLWGGFESFGIAPLHGIDWYVDGNPWINPSLTWTVGNGGCPNGQGKAAKGVSTTPPVADFMQTELFTTDPSGLLDCGAHKYSLTFDLRSEASLAPRIDWQILIRDGSNDANVVLIHLASTRSNFAGVTTAQGGNGRGRILVQNPAGAPMFINAGVVIPANNCYRLEVELDNNAPAASAVKLFIDGELRLTTARLNAAAARMDYLRIEQEVNGAPSPDNLNRLALDNVTLCREGLALNWPDCNQDCVADGTGITLGLSPDCNTNGVPDECDNADNCSCNGSAAAGDSCIWCNHEHDWGFEQTLPESFYLGPIDGQRGWRTEPPPEDNGVPIVDGQIVSSSLYPGQFAGSQILKLGSVGFGSLGEGILGPRTRNPAAADADIEFWEADIILNNAVNGDEVYFAVWDPCNDFNGAQITTDPQGTAFAGMPFTAGVRFTTNSGGIRDVELLDGTMSGLWRDQGPNRSWSVNLKKHVLISLVNTVDPRQQVPQVKYHVGTHVHGFRDAQPMWTIGMQNPAAGGDREIVVINNSLTISAYFDSFKYDRDTNCDHDSEPDSIWLTGGQFFQPCYDLDQSGLVDWCEDCNDNGILDSVEIAGGVAADCNQNDIPDACDVDPTQPRYHEVGIVPPGGCIPGGDPQGPPGLEPAGRRKLGLQPKRHARRVRNGLQPKRPARRVRRRRGHE